MTNLDTRFYNFLQSEAKKRGSSKREVLEDILARYIEWKKEEDIKKSYSAMAEDTEYLNEMQENTSYL